MPRSNNYQHGMTASATYYTWSNMKKRCLNPRNDNYAYYGGRGISVCKEWLRFTGFLEDMGERPEGKTCMDKCDSCGFEIDRDLNASINLKLYTVSSTGINASGDGKVHALNSRCPSVNEEFNSKTKELIAC